MRYEVRNKRDDEPVRGTRLEVRSEGEEVIDKKDEVENGRKGVMAKREILYNKREGKLNEGVADRVEPGKQNDERDCNRDDVKGCRQDDMQGDKLGGKRDMDDAHSGSIEKKGMEDLVRKLEALCEEMAVVKGYILALQVPLMDRCNTWVDGQTVGSVLGISTKTLKGLRDNGMMPYSKIGGKLYYRVEDMDVLLKKNYTRVIEAGGGDE